MKYLLAIAMLWAGAIVPSALNAQFHSAPRSFGAAPIRMGRNFVSTRAMSASPRMVRSFVPGRPMHGAPRTWQLRPSWCPRPGFGFGRPGFHHNRLLVIQPFLYPAFGYSPFYPYYSSWYPSGNEEQGQQNDAAMSALAQQNNLIASQLQTLSDQVRSLQDQQASRAYSPPPAATPRAAEEENVVPAVFVYRDGHQLEAANYAIFEQTVWVFGGQTSRKIPLADLNLAMTKKLNEERGIDFALPN